MPSTPGRTAHQRMRLRMQLLLLVIASTALLSTSGVLSALFLNALNAQAIEGLATLRAGSEIIQLEKELYCRDGKAGAILVVKGKKGAPNTEQFLTLAKYFSKKNRGKGLTSKQQKAVSSGGKLCSAFRKAETIYVDGKLRRTCGTSGNYSVKKRVCEKKNTRLLGFKTIQEAVNRAGPGDKILVREGRYSESVKIRRPGKLSSYLTIESAAGESVLLDGKGSKAAAFTIGGFGSRYSSSFVRIRSLRISGFTGKSVAGIVAVKDASRVVIENVIFKNNSSPAVSANKKSSVVIWGNVVSVVGASANPAFVLEAEGGHLLAYNIVSGTGGIRLEAGQAFSPAPALIHHNVVIGASGPAFEVQAGVSNELYLTGLFHNVSLFSSTGFSVASPPGQGVAIRNSAISGSPQPFLILGDTAAIGVNAVDVELDPSLSEIGTYSPSLFSPSLASDRTALTKAIDSAITARISLKKERDALSASAAVRRVVANAIVPSANLANHGEALSPPFVDLVGRGPEGAVDIGAVEGDASRPISEKAGIQSTDKSSEVLNWIRGGTAPAYLQRSKYSSLATATPTATSTRYPTRTPTITPTPFIQGLTVPTLVPGALYNFNEASRFLFEGEHAIQIGVEPGSINRDEFVVIRGKVRDSQGALAGVSVQNEVDAKIGKTFTRIDGYFDFVVNPNSRNRLRFELAGYLPVDRTVDVGVSSHEVIEDIVLTKFDSAATVIDLDTLVEPIVAGSTTQTDDDGNGLGPKSRQARMLFKPGVQAKAQLSDGSEVALNELTVRATEYTVGKDGPKRMPGPLPGVSAYTYAVELSVDEAQALGAVNVHFSQPIPFYVENFLEFPIGIPVPIGYYDRQTGYWIPSQDGRVIKILSIDGTGRAVLSVSSDGAVATGAELFDLSIDDSELLKLGQTYAPGTELWRALISHFTPWDLNYPYGLPEDAEQGEDPAPETGDLETQCKRTKPGSIIECEAQTLRESIAIPGTGMTLNYSTARSAANRRGLSVKLKVSRSSIAASTKEVVLSVRGAGREFRKVYEPTANLTEKFEWDWLDGFGRPVNGSMRFNVDVSNVYKGVYYGPYAEGLGATFARFGNEALSRNTARSEISVKSPIRSFVLNKNNQESDGVKSIGGWTLSSQHRLDTQTSTIHYGTGESAQQVTAEDYSVNPLSAKTCANYEVVFGVPVDSQCINANTKGVAADGTIFVGSFEEGSWLNRISPSGIIENTSIVTPSNGVLTNSASPIAIGPAGELFSVLSGFATPILKWDNVTTSWKTISGGTARFASGLTDGEPAKELGFDLWYFNRPVVGPDGSLYLTIVDGVDHQSGLIGRIDPTGIFHAVVGGGDAQFYQGIPARDLRLRTVTATALSPDGTLYFAIHPHYPFPNIGAVGSIVYRVGVDGRVFYVTGGGSETLPFPSGGYLGDYKIDAPINELQISKDGSLLIFTDYEVVRFEPWNGRAWIVGNLPYQAGFTKSGSGVRLVASQSKMLPDGAIVSAQGNALVRIDPRPSTKNLKVLSDDGSAILHFDSGGRIRKVTDVATGTELVTYSYGPLGELLKVSDPHGNETSVEWVDGQPTAITGPFGMKTTLFTNADGLLSEVRYPDSATYQMNYTGGDLLSSFREPSGALHTFHYSEDARLLKDLGPVGNSTTLVRTGEVNDFSVDVVTALGKKEVLQLKKLESGNIDRKYNEANGTVNLSLEFGKTESSSISATGTTTTVQQVADPRSNVGVYYPKMVSTTSGAKTKIVRQDKTYTDLPTFRRFTERLWINGSETPGASPSYYTDHDFIARTSTSTSPQGRKSKTTFDSFGRVTKSEVLPQSLGLYPNLFEFDSRGRISEVSRGVEGVDIRKSSFTYNAKGLIAKAIDPEGNETTFDYDVLGRILKKYLPDGRVVSFGYDSSGNVTSIGPPGRPSHRFEFTLLNQRESWTPPADVDDVGSDGLPTTYFYNADRELVRIQLPSAEELTFNYHVTLDRISNIELPEGTLTFSYNDVTGQVTGIDGLAGSHYGVGQSYLYSGDFLTKASWTGAVTGFVDYGYDDYFRLSSLKVGTGATTVLKYDQDSLLTEAGALKLKREVETGRLTGTELNKITDVTGYSPGFGELQSYVARESSSGVPVPVFSEVITKRDLLGRILEKSETTGGITTYFSYDYNARGQLVEVKQGPFAGALVTTALYVYDSNGNRTSVTRSATTEIGTYDNQDRLLTYDGASYSYNDNGQLKQKTVGIDVTEYRYDTRGALKSVAKADGTTISYRMDGDGRRVEKRVLVGGLEDATKTKKFLYQSALQVVAELNSAGTLISQFVYGTKANVPDYFIKGGQTYRIVSDHLGSVRLVLNAASGVVSQRIDYDEFGRIITDTNPGFQPFGFAGGLYDPDTGLTRFGARDYDPRVGRWTAKDPIDFSGGDTNLYGYVVGDPVNAIDVNGLHIFYLNEENVVGGLGHSGVLIGDDTVGWNYVSADGETSDGTDLDVDKFFKTSDEFFASADARRYNRYKFIATSRDQDLKGLIEARRRLAGEFNGALNNCGDVARGALSGLEWPRNRHNFNWTLGVTVPNFDYASLPHEGRTRR